MALSRVKLSNDIRLLVRMNDRSSMNYIKELRKNSYIKSFFEGYRGENNSKYPGTMMWDRKLAAKEAGFVL